LATEVVTATNDWVTLDVVFVADAVTIATDATATDDSPATNELTAMDAVVMATDDAAQPEFATSRRVTHFSARSCER